MIQTPMDVLSQFPVRKSKKQKAAFRESIQSYAEQLGYACAVEKGSFGSKNIVMGDPEKARYLVTAHYDTCAHMPFPNFITPCNFLVYLGYQLFVTAVMFLIPVLIGFAVHYAGYGFEVAYLVGYFSLLLFLFLMIAGPANRNNANDNTSGVVTLLEIMKTLPENQRDKVCFVLFDLEEAGLVGSASYRKRHKEPSKTQLVLNLDCVGDGDEIYFFPSKKLRKNEEMLSLLRKCAGNFGEKNITIKEIGFSVYPSDQNNFPYGVGICALRQGKFWLYMDKIHTNRDTVLEITNVNLLCTALVSMISCDAL